MGIRGKGLKPVRAGAGTKKTMVQRMKVKEIGGEKNGGKRLVRVNKMPRSLLTQEVPRKLASRQKPHSKQRRNLRASITPGTVLILVAGRHKGKRVVFLKQLSSGLLLVTGPYKINGCPLRRVNQIYTIATKTKIDISGVNLPERLTDSYFARQKLKRPRHTEGDIFESKKQEYTVSDERKEDQVAVDKQLLDAIKKSEDKTYLLQYLNAMFSLKNHEYPHKMVF